MNENLLERVRWNVSWEQRNNWPNKTQFEIDEMVSAEINAMSPLELLAAISMAFDEIRKDHES